jgi:PTS system galactitol-specific IIC component
LILAVILPGNKVLPFGDLATIPFMVAMMVPIVRGNVVRAIITSTFVMVPTLYIMNGIAGVQSEVARASNFQFPEGATLITSMVDGGNWLAYLFTLAARSFWVGNIVILAVLVLLWVLFKKNTAAWQRVAGYNEEA